MRALLVAAALMLCASPAHADDRSDVLTAVNNLMTAWRTGDRVLADRALHPEFRLATLQDGDRGRQVYLDTRERILEHTGMLHEGDWDDRLSDIHVNIDPHGLASVWAHYVFYSNGAAHHCGNVSMLLYRTPEGWRIVHFADTHNNLSGRSVREVCGR